jgi:hypothetical protein
LLTRACDLLSLCVVEATARAVAGAVDALLGYAVAVAHPQAVDARLPLEDGWLGVAAVVLRLLPRLRLGDELGSGLVKLVGSCKLGEERDQRRAEKERYPGHIPGSLFATQKSHKAFAVMCESLWKELPAEAKAKALCLAEAHHVVCTTAVQKATFQAFAARAPRSTQRRGTTGHHGRAPTSCHEIPMEYPRAGCCRS